MGDPPRTYFQRQAYPEQFRRDVSSDEVIWRLRVLPRFHTKALANQDHDAWAEWREVFANNLEAAANAIVNCANEVGMDIADSANAAISRAHEINQALADPASMTHQQITVKLDSASDALSAGADSLVKVGEEQANLNYSRLSALSGVLAAGADWLSTLGDREVDVTYMQKLLDNTSQAAHGHTNAHWPHAQVDPKYIKKKVRFALPLA